MQRFSVAEVRAGLRATFLPVVIGATLAACQGSIGGLAGDHGDGTGDNSGGGGTGSGGDSPVPGGPDAPLPAPNKGPRTLPTCSAGAEGAPLRRLTRTEYLNTVRDLFPGAALPTFTVSAGPIVRGLENNADQLIPTQLAIEEAFNNAKTIAAKLAPALMSSLPCKAADGLTCGKTFVTQFGERAFRRPLDTDEITVFQRFFTGDPGVTNFQAALTLTVQAMLAAPQFLYQLELAGKTAPGPWETANRLSYLLWQSMPDAALFQAAHDNKLASDADVLAQVERMLADGRAAGSFVDFARQWLNLDHLLDSKLTKLAPEGFDAGFRDAMREERGRFLDEILWKGGGTLKDMLTSHETVVNDRIAPLYGVAKPASGWQRVELDPGLRGAGILTQSAFLAGFAHPKNSSPVLRGVFTLDRLLCNELPPPPPGADQTPPDPAGQITNREAYRQRTQFGECASCHNLINPIGFGFENFDTMGRYRTMDNGLPVDASATVLGQDVNGAVELAGALAGSADVRICAARNFLRNAFQGSPSVEDGCLLDRAEAAFENMGGSLRGLVAFIAREPGFLNRPLSSR